MHCFLPGRRAGLAPARRGSGSSSRQCSSTGARCRLGETGYLETAGSLFKEASSFVISLQGKRGCLRSYCGPALPGRALGPGPAGQLSAASTPRRRMAEDLGSAASCPACQATAARREGTRHLGEAPGLASGIRHEPRRGGQFPPARAAAADYLKCVSILDGSNDPRSSEPLTQK